MVWELEIGVLKYIVAGISFVIVFVFVALIVGYIVAIIIRPEGSVTIGIGTRVYDLPGTLLGLFAGVYSWKTALRNCK